MKSGLRDKNKKEFKDGDKVFWTESLEQYAEPTAEEEQRYSENFKKLLQAGVTGGYWEAEGKRLPDKVIGHSGTVKHGFFDVQDEYDHKVLGWYVQEKKEKESLAEIWKRLTIMKRKK